MNQSLTLFDAVQLWEQSPICVNTPRLKANLATVMRNYILPASFGLDISRLRSDYFSVMRNVSLVDFLVATKDVLDLFSHPDDYGVRASTFRYYRNVTVKFFDFLYCLINDNQVSGAFAPIPQFLPKSKSVNSERVAVQKVLDTDNGRSLNGKELDGGGRKLDAGNGGSLNGRELDSGSRELDSGSRKLDAGGRKLDTGNGGSLDGRELDSGGRKLDAGNGGSLDGRELDNGGRELDGKELDNGSRELNTGNDRSLDGKELDSGSRELDNGGSRELDAGNGGNLDGKELDNGGRKLDAGGSHQRLSYDNSGNGRGKFAISLADEGISNNLKNEVLLWRDYAKAEGFDEATIDNYLGHIFYFLGWLVRNNNNYALSDLSLDLVTDNIYSHGFIDWGLIQRGNSLGWAVNVLYACLLTARFLSHQGGDYDNELQALSNYLRVINEQLSQDNNDLQVKSKLTFSMAVEVVDYLRSCCAVYHGNGSRRSNMAIVKSWQRYLLVGLLVFCPISSRHLCQLILDDSLVWQDERFYVDLSVLKTRVSTVMMRFVPIPSFLSEDLLLWCQDLRPLVGSNNNYVFMKLGSPRCPQSQGEPLSVKDLSDIVGGCTAKATLNLFGNAISVKPTSLSGLTNDYLQMLAMMYKTIDYSDFISDLNLIDSRNQLPTTRALDNISYILEQAKNPQKGRKTYPLLTDLFFTHFPHISRKDRNITKKSRRKSGTLVTSS